MTSVELLGSPAIEPNPARDRRVRLPHEESDEIVPPTAGHVEAVYRLLPSGHRLPLLFLDWSGARVAAVETLLVGDYFPDVLADAVEAELGPREDRDPAARLFADSGANALRTAIGKACAALAIPLFSPHDLRHRRISLLHRQGRS
jgi:hypothetical protein